MAEIRMHFKKKEWHHRLSTIDPILSRRITNHGPNHGGS